MKEFQIEYTTKETPPKEVKTLTLRFVSPNQGTTDLWHDFILSNGREAKKEGLDATDIAIEKIERGFQMLKGVEAKKRSLLFEHYVGTDLKNADDFMKVSAENFREIWKWFESAIGWEAKNKDFTKP